MLGVTSQVKAEAKSEAGSYKPVLGEVRGEGFLKLGAADGQNGGLTVLAHLIPYFRPATEHKAQQTLHYNCQSTIMINHYIGWHVHRG